MLYARTPATPAASFPTPTGTPHQEDPTEGRTRHAGRNQARPSPVSPPPSTPARHPRTAGSSHDLPAVKVLLRKEVIQPHLPVRLPCYDFVPIASPTFDHSLRTTG